MTTQPHPFDYLKDYSHFTSVPEMDQHVKMHVQAHKENLKQSTREVLHAIAGHALNFTGATHLKAETIAKEIGMSAKSVYRAVKDLVGLGIVAKENKPKMNGIKGANIYAILPYDQSNVPFDVSHREETVNPSISKDEGAKKEPVSLNLLITKSIKDTNITENHTAQFVDKETIKKNALLEKLPTALRGLSVFFDMSQDIYDMSGVIFRAKNKVAKEIRIEEHESLFKKTIASVYEYWKRQVKAGNVEYNVFGLMDKAIKELVAKIIDGSAYETKAVAIPVGGQQKGRTELVPDWFHTRHEQPVEVATETTDFEAARIQLLKKLGYSDEEIMKQGHDLQ